MRSSLEYQLFRLASDNQSIYEAGRQWFLDQGQDIAPVLADALDNPRLGSIAHWRILLLLREFALPSTLPAVLKAFRSALERDDVIVLPGAMEALAAFKNDEALEALISVFQTGTAHQMTHAAALLANWENDRATEALISLLDHEDAFVRKSALKALQKINTPLAQEAVERYRLRETDPNA
jgi:HEAT repeat protein